MSATDGDILAIAKALRANARTTKVAFQSERSEWARAWRRSADDLIKISRLIERREFDKIAEVGK